MDIVNDNRITAVSGGWGALNQDSISTMNDALAKAIEKAISYAKQHPLPPSKLIAGEVEKMVLRQKYIPTAAVIKSSAAGILRVKD